MLDICQCLEIQQEGVLLTSRAQTTDAAKQCAGAGRHVLVITRTLVISRLYPSLLPLQEAPNGDLGATGVHVDFPL